MCIKEKRAAIARGQKLILANCSVEDYADGFVLFGIIMHIKERSMAFNVFFFFAKLSALRVLLE